MAIKVAINGFGRIGRNVFRAMFESGQQSHFEVIAINDLGDAATNAHLLQYDTAHGRFGEAVTVEDDCFVVGDKRVKVLAERDPASLPWGRGMWMWKHGSCSPARCFPSPCISA